MIGVPSRTHGGANYLVDVTIIDATLGQLPNTYNPGKSTDTAFNDKVTQYADRFPRLDTMDDLCIAAFEKRGAPAKGH